MPTPIFILAGQSNVALLSDEIEASLEAELGVGNFELLRVFASGAPLTRERPDQPDWSNPEELRTELTVETVNALLADDDRTFGGLIWVQGEADTYFPNGANQYAEDLEGVLNDFRDGVADVFGEEDVGLGSAPITILELSENAPAASEREGWATVIDEQRNVAEDDALVQTLDPDAVAEDANIAEVEMFADGLHYSDEFSSLLADELVQTMVSPSDDDVKTDDNADEDLIVDEIEEEQPVEVIDPEPPIPFVDIVEPIEDEDEDLNSFSNFDDSSGIEAIFWALPILGLIAGLG
jgi:hypothetical protein